jgi:hypothetical protein
MEGGADGKFKSSALPGALTPGEDESGAGETRYEEPIESLRTPVAVASNPAFHVFSFTFNPEHEFSRQR